MFACAVFEAVAVAEVTLKSKTTKFLNKNLLKLDEIQTLASATLKMTS